MLDRAAFAQYVQHYLTTQVGIAVLHSTERELTLQLNEAPVRIQLTAAYATYLHDPTRLLSLMQALVSSVQRFKPDQLITDFEVLRGVVYPMLKPLELLVPVREQNLPMLAYDLFLADLMITYVIDEGTSVTYINEQHLACWEVEQPMLQMQALANLRRRTTQIHHTTMGLGAQRLFLFNSQDGYDATRLLLPELLDTWRLSLPGRMIIGIPNRDLLVAFSDRDATTFEKVVHQMQLDTVQHPAGLTDQLFTLIDGRVQLYRE